MLRCCRCTYILSLDPLQALPPGSYPSQSGSRGSQHSIASINYETVSTIVITNSKPAVERAVTSAKVFLTDATSQHRLAMLHDEELFAGFCVINDKKHAKPVFFPNQVLLEDESGDDRDFLLVQCSNDPSLFCPELLPMEEVVSMAIVLLPVLPADIPAIFQSKANKNIEAFQRSHVEESCPALASLIPDHSITYSLVALPVAILISYGVEATVRGPIDESHVDAFAPNLTVSNWWMDNIVHWSEDIQSAAVGCRKALDKKFPKLTHGTHLATLVFIRSIRVAPNDEKLAGPLQVLLDKLSLLSLRVSLPPPSPVSLPPAFAAGEVCQFSVPIRSKKVRCEHQAKAVMSPETPFMYFFAVSCQS